MEDVLVLYEMPYDARYPTVCLDEKPVVLHAEVRESLPPALGQVERRDYEYEHDLTPEITTSGCETIQRTEERFTCVRVGSVKSRLLGS
jgi:hypothetical protein